jgi:hypothetical protein
MTKNPAISMVSDHTRPTLEPPSALGEAGRTLWERVQAEFAIADCGGVELLFQACSAADRAAELQRQIDGDGCVVYGKAGLPKEHPLLRGNWPVGPSLSAPWCGSASPWKA